MRKLAGWVGLLSLSGLALLTTSINVRATQRSYALGRALLEQQDLTDLIRFRRSCCRDLCSTRNLAAALEHLELSSEELYLDPLPSSDVAGQPLALGVN